MVNDDRFWEKNIMGENISVTKIKHLEKFMQNIPLNIFFKDTECKYIYASEICKNLNKHGDDWTIYGKTDLEIQPFPELGRQYYEEDKKLIQNGGSLCYTSVFPMEDKDYYYEIKKQAVADDNGNIIGIVGTVTDVTELMTMRNKMEEYYMTDPLTGLYNRKYLEAWKKVEAPIYPISFISCDCNELKHINDTYGHEYGDQLLCFVGELFRTYLPKNCCAIREGGGEFLIICNDTSEVKAKEIVDNLVNKAKHLYVKGHKLSIAYGMVTMNEENYDFNEAHRIADCIMYEAKRAMKKLQNQS